MIFERQQKLKPILTDEFLKTLVEAAKIYGWAGDYIEVCQFIEDLYEVAGKEKPDLEPYEDFE